MRKFLKQKLGQSQYLGCLVCGVDSKPVLTFFLWLIGAGVTASLCVMVWGYATGKFSSEEKASLIPLDAEKIDTAL